MSSQFPQTYLEHWFESNHPEIPVSNSLKMGIKTKDVYDCVFRLSVTITAHRCEDMDDETLDFAFQLTKDNMQTL